MADQGRSTISGKAVGASAAEVNTVGAGATDSHAMARRAAGTLDIGTREMGARTAASLSAPIGDEPAPAERPSVLRLALWGAGAAASVVCVLFAATTDLGTRRAAAGVAAIMSPPHDAGATIAQVAARSAETDRENRRLFDTVRALTAERDRIAMRVDSVEREMGDLTGSIKRVTAQNATAQPANMPARPAAAEPKAAEPRAAEIQPPETRESLAPARTQTHATKTQDRQPIATASAEPPTPVAQRQPAPPPTLIPPIKPVVSMPPSPLGAIPQPKPTSDAMLNLALTAPVFGLDSKMPKTQWPVKTGAAPLADTQPKAVAPEAFTPAKAEAAPEAAPSAEAPATTGSVAETTEPQPTVQLGVDLGPGMTMAKLRARWNSFKSAKSAEAESMHPLVMAREITPGKPVELRLIVGPVADIKAAAQLCASLVGTPFLCQPSVYDGQRLALH